MHAVVECIVCGDGGIPSVHVYCAYESSTIVYVYTYILYIYRVCVDISLNIPININIMYYIIENYDWMGLRANDPSFIY